MRSPARETIPPSPAKAVPVFMTPVPCPSPLVFVDLETTGANFANDRIIEIGLVEVDAEGVREWSSLVNPGVAISPFISRLTGIDDTMVADAPEFAGLAPLLQEKFRGRLFIAHNARFDYSFLKREFMRLGIAFRMPCLCTVKLSRRLYPEHHRHSLDALMARFQISASERHRALADARVLWELWQAWHRLLPPESVQQTVESLLGRPVLPPQIATEIIDDLPESPGAYALSTEDGRLLRTGRCANLRQQILSFFAPARRETALARETRRIDWRETAGETGARLAEHAFSAATKKPLDGLYSWQLRPYAEGDFRPVLVSAEALDFASNDDLFGLYLSPREAQLALRKLVEAHHLCHGLTGTGHTAPGEACVGYRQKTCRGACIGKEAASLHSARLMAALARLRVQRWPCAGPAVLIERDEFGMHEDFHLIDRWRYLGTVHSEAELYEYLENTPLPPFDPEIYRILNKATKGGKVQLLTIRKNEPDNGC